MLTFLMNSAVVLDATAAGAGSMMTTFITFGLIILIFYFLMIRPQKKRDKETKAMLDAMKKGDKVVSIGGIHGTVVAVREATVIVKVDDNTRVEFTKNAISQVVDSAKAKAAAQQKVARKDEKGDKGEIPAKEEAPAVKTEAADKEKKN